MKLFLTLITFTASIVFADVCRVTNQFDSVLSVTSLRQLPERKDRKCLIIQNNGSVAVHLKFNSAHSSTENISLAAGATFAPIVVPVNAIYGRSASSTATITIIEGK